jgi:hypothetical protein
MKFYAAADAYAGPSLEDAFITGGYSLAITLAALLLTLVTARLSWIYFEKSLVKIGHRSSYKFGVTESVTAMTPLPTEGN